MAHIVTVKFLIDSDNAGESDEVVQRILDELGEFIGDEYVVDSSIERVEPSNSAIQESIETGNYIDKSFVKDWVIFSPEKAEESENCYWSNEYGWKNLDLATIFDAQDVNMPSEDAILVMRQDAGQRGILSEQ